MDDTLTSDRIDVLIEQMSRRGFRVIHKHSSNPDLIISVIMTRKEDLLITLINGYIEGDSTLMYQRFYQLFTIFRSLQFAHEPMLFDWATHTLMLRYHDPFQDRFGTLETLKLIVRHGIGVNGILTFEDGQYPVFIAARLYYVFPLMEYLMTQSDFLVLPDYLTSTDDTLAQITRIRNGLLQVLNPEDVPNNKRVRCG